MKGRSQLKRALNGDGEHPLVDVLAEAAWMTFKDSGCDDFAADAAWDAGSKVALKGGNETEVWQAAIAAGYHVIMDFDIMQSLSGRREFTARVKAFGTKRSGHRGRYVTPLIYLSDIHVDGKRIGNQWFQLGKAWEGLKERDKVSFYARAEGYKLVNPSKVRKASIPAPMAQPPAETAAQHI